MAIHITRVGGARVDKDCRKLESYGTVDELICLVGIARTGIASAPKRSKAEGPVSRARLEEALRRVQNRLFDVGSILATPAGQSYPGMPQIGDDDAAVLEKDMDAMQAALPALDSFVLPGGSPANAALHHCRAVCRRAEREIIRLSREEAVDPRLIKYVNRLSDWFFVMARYAARLDGAPEYLWEYGKKKGKPSAGAGAKIRKPRRP
jgi:cob(I)alamin adenosyltransferase